jgi:hypothetical protein
VAQIFTKSWNYFVLIATAKGVGLLVFLVFMFWYWFSPEYTDVGFHPDQPVPFSHKLHAGELGMDCRYCHNTVEDSAHAAVPPTATCMNCHKAVKTDSVALEPIRHSYSNDVPVEWVRVHMLPDYAFFDHSVHVAAGVGCTSCHGRIDQMVKVTQSEPLSMGWCLECHRNPTPNLRPRDKVTDMSWDSALAGYNPHTDPLRQREVNPPQHCSGCHR